MRHQAWNNFSQDIKGCELKDLMKNSSFMQTMFSSQFETQELNYLQNEYSLDEIYCLSYEIVENMPESNNIHQLYHLTRFLQYADKSKFSNITEFGGGYGSLCMVVNRLLKPEGYNIIDLPELSDLQARYLNEHQVKANLVNSLDGLESGETFIANWSLSETPEELRKEYLHKLNYKNYFFAYGDAFFDLENHKFFEEFTLKRPNIKWYLEPISFMQQQYYLMGKS